MPVLNPREITQRLSEAIAESLKRLEKITKDGSGWKLKRCELLDLKNAPYSRSVGEATSRRLPTSHRGQLLM